MRCGHATQQGIKQSLVKLNHLRYSIVRSKKIEFDCLFTCSTKGELTQALCSAALSTFYLWEKVRTIRIKSAGYEMIKHDTVSWNYMELWQHSYKPSITHSSGPVCISCDCGFLDKGTLRPERNETKQKKIPDVCKRYCATTTKHVCCSEQEAIPSSRPSRRSAWLKLS